MLDARETFDPKVHGRLKAVFLNNLALTPEHGDSTSENDQEKERLAFLKKIRDGELAPTKPPM